ncbi:MAG: MiaB/RimO family radical SAM methylthiotransferase [Lachnospiraceae bacterium]|nr:MiaB/RimO family radical SAM methylthiotransferase [Lachnospiraceae bacterium]
MKSVALHNLGCKVNAYEMDIMQQMLQEKGYIIVPFHEVADIYIVNTCTVTNIADRKSRQMLHQAKARNPKAIVVAVGCYVQTGEEEAKKDTSIDLAIGNNKKKELVSILEEFLRQREETGTQTEESSEKTLHGASMIDINASCDYEEVRLKRTAEHTRAYMKIQDGCNQFCSYCIIPYARGRVRSRKWEDIRQEMEGLAEAGYKEVVFTGIHISSYGLDFDEEAWRQGNSLTSKKENGIRTYTGTPKLLELLERVQDVPGIERIRLGSLEPRIITKETAKRLAAIPKICPHFHLSLQSGCDETLKRMNRHYTTSEYLQCVGYLREVFDNPAITTDVIVGFPGETEEEFERTYSFLRETALYEMHIFKYSRRKGTVAAKLPGQVPTAIQSERSSRLFALEKELSAAYRATYIGTEAEVLFEGEKELNGKRYQLGHTPQYVRVALQTEEDMSNRIYRGRITGLLEDEILLIE